MAEFNPGLVSGNPDDHERIAAAIAQFVDADMTEPQLPDNRDAWRSDFEMRELEKPVGYDARQWDRYADVCRRAAAHTQSPSGRALLILCHLNGERRVPEQNWGLVGELAGQARELINSLEEGSRKERLATLLDYHLGIVARYVGEYERGIAEQIKAAERAEAQGDYVGAVIARLCEQVERFNQALSEGGDTDELIGSLHEAALRTAAVCTGSDPVQISWRYFSAPTHVLQAHIWGVRRLPLHEERFWTHLLMEEFPRVDPSKFETYLPGIVAIQAGLAFLKNQRRDALRLANEVLTAMSVQARADALMTARFVLAMLAADEHLEVIAEEGSYMHQLRRMARRILSGEVKPWCAAHVHAQIA